jgi:hypothetical protein
VEIWLPALAWEAIAQRLRAAKARVVVLLDVCHAGLSEQAVIAGNDVATTQLMTNSGASMIIISASKGRQYSNETATGGLFSKLLEQIIVRERNRSMPLSVRGSESRRRGVHS